jgi:hypothetical protein
MAERNLGEPDAHRMMRYLRSVLLGLLCVSLIATALLLIFYRPAAYLAGLPLPVLALAFIAVLVLERRATAERLRAKHAAAISQKEVEMDVQYAGVYTALNLALLFAASTFVMAATMMEDLSMVGASAALLLLLAIFYALPYLPFLIADSGQEERDKLQHQVDGRPDPANNPEKSA